MTDFMSQRNVKNVRQPNFIMLKVKYDLIYAPEFHCLLYHLGPEARCEKGYLVNYRVGQSSNSHQIIILDSMMMVLRETLIVLSVALKCSKLISL